MKNLITLFLIIIFPFQIFATTYYVSPAGLGINSGDQTNPFKTIQKCVDIVVAGDTCIVEDGLYTDDNGDDVVVRIINKNGSKNNWITIKSRNKWGATLDGEKNKTNFGFQFLTSNFIRIEGFEVKNTHNAALHINTKSTYIYYKNNWIHDIAIRASTGGQAAAYNTFKSNHITYDGNIIHTIGSHAFYIRGEYTTIMNNIIYDVSAANPQGFMIQMAGDGADIRCKCINHSKIVNNTFVRTTSDRIGNINIWQGVDDLIIENNIFLLGSYASNKNYGAIENIGSYIKTNIVIRNNLTDSASMLKNTWNGNDDNFSYSDNILSADSSTVFVDIKNKDFKLSSTSPALNKGLSIKIPTHDFVNTIRPKDGIHDIGAYEYLGKVKAPHLINIKLFD